MLTESISTRSIVLYTKLIAIRTVAGIGIAVYIACWVFFFPVMLIICVVIGLFFLWAAERGK